MIIMNTTIISFNELVNVVSNGTSFLKKNYKMTNNHYETTINKNEFEISTYSLGVLVMKHIPTGASIRATLTRPFSNVKVEKVEIMPKGKKNYIYVADYPVFPDRNDEYSITEVIFEKSKKVDSFNIGLFCSL